MHITKHKEGTGGEQRLGERARRTHTRRKGTGVGSAGHRDSGSFPQPELLGSGDLCLATAPIYSLQLQVPLGIRPRGSEKSQCLQRSTSTAHWDILASPSVPPKHWRWLQQVENMDQFTPTSANRKFCGCYYPDTEGFHRDLTTVASSEIRCQLIKDTTGCEWRSLLRKLVIRATVRTEWKCFWWMRCKRTKFPLKLQSFFIPVTPFWTQELTQRMPYSTRKAEGLTGFLFLLH